MSSLLAWSRSALYLGWLVVTLLPWATAVVLAAPFVGSRQLYAICLGWLHLAIHGARVIAGVRWRVRGVAHVAEAGRADRGLLIASKHQSTWEAFALPLLMPRQLAYVFKRELLWIPFFGWAIGCLDMVHIDRARRVEAWARVHEQGRRLLARGCWIIVFPEGTRTPRGGQGVYKSGVARLALATGASIVPVAVASARCWPRRSFVLRPGLVEVSIGPPIAPGDRDAEALMREVEAWIEAEMRRLDPQAYDDAPGT